MGGCRLAILRAECDGTNCEAQKVIHTVQDAAVGTWITKVDPRNWHFHESAVCDRGHRLRLVDSERLKFVPILEAPF
jgi:hypothetical protein